MLQARHLSIAFLALSVSLAGCSKDEKKKDNKASEKASAVEEAPSKDKAGAGRTMPAPKKSADAPMPVKAPGAVSDGPDAAAGGFDMIHKDMDLVVGANFNSVRANPLYQMARPMLMATLEKESGGQYAKYTSACGFDPFDTIASAMMGGKMKSDDDNYLFVITGIDDKRLQTCLEGIGKLANEKVQVKKDGNITTFTAGEKDDELHVAWTGASSLIFAPDMSKDDLKARAAGTDGMSGNAVMSELLSKVNSTATMWMAATPPDEQKKDDDMPFELQGLHLSVDMNKGMAVKAGLLAKDEAEAKKGADALQEKMKEGMKEMEGNPMAAMAGKYVEKVKVAADGKYVNVSLDLNDTEYQELLKMGSSFAQMAAMHQ